MYPAQQGLLFIDIQDWRRTHCYAIFLYLGWRGVILVLEDVEITEGNNMNLKSFFFIVAIVFLYVSLLHLTRILFCENVHGFTLDKTSLRI